MRALRVIGLAVALASCVAGAVSADPPPFLLPRRPMPRSAGLPLRPPMGQTPQAAADGVFHSFGSGSDGRHPAANLIDVNGVLYGTTRDGGKYGGGTVFALTATGTERVLHDFGNGADSAAPYAGLVDVGGVLYGTTCDGGKYNNVGTVFAVTVAGTERVLHSFGEGTDGVCPFGGLVDVGGVLYGAAAGGGKYDKGMVFAITTTGTERAVYNFSNRPADGEGPFAGLVYIDGVFYGTTYEGGKFGRGTVFAVTAAGAERVLYSLGSGTDGEFPDAVLIDHNGVLYGTTESGGKYQAGTVFAVTANGTERVLHNFGNGTDGQEPLAGLIDVNGVLYGTTRSGGTFHEGTVFEMTTAGSEHVLRNFSFAHAPEAQLLDVNGVLYGTTSGGGSYSLRGTAFAVSP